MGIWATWVPLGASLMFVLAPQNGGCLWLAVDLVVQRWLYSAIGFWLVLIFMRMPPDLQADPAASRTMSVGNDTLNLKASPVEAGHLATGGIFGLFSLANVSLSTYYPTFLPPYADTA